MTKIAVSSLNELTRLKQWTAVAKAFWAVVGLLIVDQGTSGIKARLNKFFKGLRALVKCGVLRLLVIVSSCNLLSQSVT
jgi:hypothetical protein